MLFCERGTEGEPLFTASVAFDPDVAAPSAMPMKMALSVDSERPDTDISRESAMRADGTLYVAAFIGEGVSRWRLVVFGIVGHSL
jgi:hypothetical protein